MSVRARVKCTCLSEAGFQSNMSMFQSNINMGTSQISMGTGASQMYLFVGGGVPVWVEEHEARPPDEVDTTPA